MAAEVITPILDDSRWAGEVAPDELLKVEQYDGRTVEVAGQPVTFTVFNVLTYAAHDPEAVWAYTEQAHPEVYDVSPMQYRSPDEFRLDWLVERFDTLESAVVYDCLLKVAQTMVQFEGTATSVSSQALRAHHDALRYNWQTFSCEVGPIEPDGLSVYRGDGRPVKLVPNDEILADPMEW